MKKYLFMILMLGSLSARSQLAPLRHTDENRVLTNRATQEKFALIIPGGLSPVIPAYVPDSLKTKMLWMKTSGGNEGLYRYNGTTWVFAVPSPDVTGKANLAGGNTFTGKNLFGVLVTSDTVGFAYGRSDSTAALMAYTDRQYGWGGHSNNNYGFTANGGYFKLKHTDGSRADLYAGDGYFTNIRTNSQNDARYILNNFGTPQTANLDITGAARIGTGLLLTSDNINKITAAPVGLQIKNGTYTSAIDASRFAIFDDNKRYVDISATGIGIGVDAQYSGNRRGLFNDLSLVDKGYVDSVATGVSGLAYTKAQTDSISATKLSLTTPDAQGVTSDIYFNGAGFSGPVSFHNSADFDNTATFNNNININAYTASNGAKVLFRNTDGTIGAGGLSSYDGTALNWSVKNTFSNVDFGSGGTNFNNSFNFNNGNNFSNLTDNRILVYSPSNGNMAGYVPLSSYLPASGGTISGQLAVSGDVYTSQYLFGNIINATAVVNTKDLTVSGSVTLNHDAVGAMEPVTKNQFDNYITGVTWKQEVRVKTTGNITLSGTQTVDGVALALNDRVLVASQTTQANNGIYLVKSTAWTRTVDADAPEEISTAAVLVRLGTANKNTQWTCTNATDPVIGTDAITFGQLSGAGTYTNGSSMSLSANVFDVNYSALDGHYVQLAGSYSNPSWITNLASSKITYPGTTSQYLRGDGSASTFLTDVQTVGDARYENKIATHTANGVYYGDGSAAIQDNNFQYDPALVALTLIGKNNTPGFAMGNQPTTGATLSGTTLFNAGGFGYTSTGVKATQVSSLIASVSTEDYTTTAQGSMWKFYTKVNGTNILREALRLNNDGAADFSGSVRPFTNGLYDIGSSSLVWNKLWTNSVSSVTTNNGSVTFGTAGITALRNVADASTAFTVNQSNVASTGNIQDWQSNGATLAKIYVGGGMGINSIGNLTTGLNSKISLNSTGTVISRDVADANSAFIINQINASSTGNILNLQAAGVTKASVSRTGNISLPHLIGNSTAPTIAAGAGAGTIPTVSISGTDLAGTITVTTGTSPTAAGILATITFNTAYGSAPSVVFSDVNDNVGAVKVSSTTGAFVLTAKTGVTLAASTTYKYNYIVAQ